MSKITSVCESSNLKVTNIVVDEMNPIIFKTKVAPNVCGLTKDGDKYFKLDTRNNTAVEFNAALIKSGAETAATTGEDDKGLLEIAENFGLIREITLEKTDRDTDGIASVFLLKSLGLEVTDVSVIAQQDIIFKTIGINHIEGLTKDGSAHYKIDTKKNTATLINPQLVAEQAAKDILAGVSSDYTALADSFNLISKIMFKRSEA